MANMDPNSTNQVMYMEMRGRLLKGVDDALRLKGKTYDGIKVQFTQVNK